MIAALAIILFIILASATGPRRLVTDTTHIDWTFVQRVFRTDSKAAQLYVARRLWCRRFDALLGDFDHVTGTSRDKWLDRADHALALAGIRFSPGLAVK